MSDKPRRIGLPRDGAEPEVGFAPDLDRSRSERSASATFAAVRDPV